MKQFFKLGFMTFVISLAVSCTPTTETPTPLLDPVQSDVKSTADAAETQIAILETQRAQEATQNSISATQTAIVIESTMIALGNLQTQAAQASTDTAIGGTLTQIARPTNTVLPSATPLPNTATLAPQPTSGTATVFASTPTIQPTKFGGVLFEDDFSSNKNGWSLDATDNGSVSLREGYLVIKVNREKCISATLPQSFLGNELYFETQLVPNDYGLTIGLSIGVNKGAYTTFAVKGRYDAGEWWTTILRPNGERRDVIFGKPIWITNEEFSFGLQVKGGEFTTFLNGNQLEIAQENVEKGLLAFTLCNPTGDKERSVSFNSVIVRSTR